MTSAVIQAKIPTTKRRHSTPSSKTSKQDLMMAVLLKAQERFSKKQEDVNRLRFCCNKTWQEYRGGNTEKLTELEELLSDPSWLKPPEEDEDGELRYTKDVGTQTTQKQLHSRQETTTKHSSSRPAIPVHFSNCIATVSPVQSPTKLPQVNPPASRPDIISDQPEPSYAQNEWTRISNTLINGQPWFINILNTYTKNSCNPANIRCLPSHVELNIAETLLIYQALDLVRHTVLATFQAINLKLAVALLIAKGMSLEQIKTCFEQASNEHEWPLERVRRIQATDINSMALGRACSLGAYCRQPPIASLAAKVSDNQNHPQTSSRSNVSITSLPKPSASKTTSTSSPGTPPAFV